MTMLDSHDKQGPQNLVLPGTSVPLRATIRGVGTATPATSYSQTELLDLFNVRDRRVRSLFLNSAIERRCLTLPEITQDGTPRVETQGELLEKHRSCAITIGSQAVLACLDNIGATPADISYLCCVTTTGFLSPGLSAFLCRELSLNPACARLDIVGMGCNAGLNALNAGRGWVLANPRRLAVLLCVEICSAGYVIDETVRTAVVNSLFGDGAAAVALSATDMDRPDQGPQIMDFHSQIMTDAIDAMRYDWDDVHGKFSFFLDPQIPYIIGANIEMTLDALLSRAGLYRPDIRHWLVHSGGKKVVDAIRVNLGLSTYDLRHTSSVLRDYGNLSSGSFLFSLERLLREHIAVPGDYGVMITMGPGSTIESALLRW
jgi:polyketide synthase Type III